MNIFAKYPKARLAFYIGYGVGSLVMTYLGSKEYVGADEVALWTGLGAFLGLTAGANVDLSEPYVGEHVDVGEVT